MKHYQSIVLTVWVSFTFAACDDDFLATVPPDVVSDEVFWTQEKDAVLAVNALYTLNHDDEAAFEFEAASDNTWAQKSFDAWYPVGQGTVTPTNDVIEEIWNDSYTAIRRVNEILANIDRIPEIDPALKERLIGEARFHRGYHYNYLVNLYGDIPLVLQPLSIEEAREVTRTPTSQVVDQILEDLDAAAAVLPQSYGGDNVGRATVGAALAYKARAAIWASRWQEAADAAWAVIQLNEYSLHPEYGELTRYAGDDSEEIIFADRRAQNVRAQGAFNALGPRSLEGGSTFTPLRGLVDAYHMEDGLPTDASPLFDPDDPYANRDPRMYATLLYPGATFAGETFNSLPSSTTADQVRSDFNATATGYQFIKYVDPADRSDRGNSGIDFILMRYADVLLMYAEAKIELGQIDQTVVDAINEVRERAGMPLFSLADLAANGREIVRHERRIELAQEGLRLFDIRRWRLAEEVMPGQHLGIDYVDEDGQPQTIPADLRQFNPARDYLWPIPQQEIDLNEVIAQNPLY